MLTDLDYVLLDRFHYSHPPSSFSPYLYNHIGVALPILYFLLGLNMLINYHTWVPLFKINLKSTS